MCCVDYRRHGFGGPGLKELHPRALLASTLKAVERRADPEYWDSTFDLVHRARRARLR